MAEEYDDYLSGRKLVTDFIQDKLEGLGIMSNMFIYKGDIGPVNIHVNTAARYASQSSLRNNKHSSGVRRAIQPGDVKQRILTDEGAIEFSAIILSHVIDDLAHAENGVVFPRNEDKSLEKLQRDQIHANAFRQGVDDYLKKVRAQKQKDPDYVTDPGVNDEDLRERGNQIKNALCDCLKASY